MSQFPLKFMSLLFLAIVFYSSTFAQASTQQIDKNKISEYFQNEQYADAVQYLENKNILNSTDQNSFNDLGYAYYMSKKYTEAKTVYSKTTSLDSLIS